MVTQELLSFLQDSLKAGKSINDIELEMVTKGWQAEEIQEAFLLAGNQISPQSSTSNSNKPFSLVNILFPIFRNIKFIIPAVIIVIMMGGIFVHSLNRKPQQESKSIPQNTSEKIGFGNLIPQGPQQKIVASSPSYRLFLKTVPGVGRKVSYKLTLVSPEGKLVKTIDTPYQLVLKASFKGMWLLAETFNSCLDTPGYDRNDMKKNCNFWLLHSDGRFEKVAESFNIELVKALGGNQEFEHLFPVSDREVIYQRCDNVNGCKIYKVDLLTGEKKEIQEISAKSFYVVSLEQVSPDYSTAYLFGTELKYPKELLESPKSPESIYDAESILKDVKPIMHFLTLNLKTGKINDLTVSGVSSFYNKYWVSPNGKYIAYVIDAGNTIEIFDIANKKNRTVKLPNRWVTESLGGNTLPTPIWSPDSNKFLFASYIQSPEAKEIRITKKMVAYIHVSSSTAVTIYTVDTQKDLLENEKNNSDFQYNIDGLGWFDNNIAQFTLYKYKNRETNTQSVNNYEFKTDIQKLQAIPNEYGQLLGSYYF